MDSGGEVKAPVWMYLDIGEVVSEDNVEVTIAILPIEDEDVGNLIAAAPELLAALKALLLHNCVVDPTYGMKDAEDLYAESCALEAIAKATGSTRDGAPPQPPLKATERGG